MQGRTTLGSSCTVHPFVSLGGPPQDITYKDENTTCILGDKNVIREYVTINRGTKGDGATVVGSNNFIMAYSHIAHDCIVGNSVIMANGATLAGHVHVDDFAILSGLCAIHQFCKVGKHAFVSGLTGVPKDVPPFVMAAGNRATPLRAECRRPGEAGFLERRYRDAEEGIPPPFPLVPFAPGSP